MLFLQPLFGESLFYIPARGCGSSPKTSSLSPVQLLLLTSSSAVAAGHLWLQTHKLSSITYLSNMNIYTQNDHFFLFTDDKFKFCCLKVLVESVCVCFFSSPNWKTASLSSQIRLLPPWNNPSLKKVIEVNANVIYKTAVHDYSDRNMMLTESASGYVQCVTAIRDAKWSKTDVKNKVYKIAFTWTALNLFQNWGFLKWQQSTVVLAASRWAVRSLVKSELNTVFPKWGCSKSCLQPLCY